MPCKLAELGVDRGLVLEHVERRARKFAVFQLLDQRMLIDDLTARGVDDKRRRLH